MTRILFVCHGNICRSPMAEFVMKHLVDEAGFTDRFYIASAATSTEELGSDIHPGTRRMLDQHGIPHPRRHARQLRRDEANDWDYIVGMDEENMRNIARMLGPDARNKTSKLLSFAGSDADVADPWYTDNFEATYRDVLAGCQALLERVRTEAR